MTTASIVLLSAGYVGVAVLLVSLHLASTLRWQIKLAAAVAVGILYLATYFGLKELPGWPSDAVPPDYFRLHWAVVVEPDKLTGAPGEILIWVQALDENDLPISSPRAHRLAYDDALAERIDAALHMVADGRQVAGAMIDDRAATTAADNAPGGGDASGGGNLASSATYPGTPGSIYFEQMRPPPQPAKEVL